MSNTTVPISTTEIMQTEVIETTTPIIKKLTKKETQTTTKMQKKLTNMKA